MMKRVIILTLFIIVISVSTFVVNRTVWMQSNEKNENAGSDLVINFNSSQVTENVWFGNTTGDVSGEVTLEALNNSPQIFRGTWAGGTRWQINAGSDSFIAQMNGKINTYNGVLLMRGIVLNGTNAGNSVTARGQVVAINPHQFAGTIRVAQP